MVTVKANLGFHWEGPLLWNSFFSCSVDLKINMNMKEYFLNPVGKVALMSIGQTCWSRSCRRNGNCLTWILKVLLLYWTFYTLEKEIFLCGFLQKYVSDVSKGNFRSPCPGPSSWRNHCKGYVNIVTPAKKFSGNQYLYVYWLTWFHKVINIKAKG